MSKAVAADTLAEGRAGFKVTSKGTSSEGTYRGLKDAFSEGPIWIVDREGERGIVFALDVLRTEEPSRSHNKLDIFKNWVEAKSSLKGCLQVDCAIVIGSGNTC